MVSETLTMSLMGKVGPFVFDDTEPAHACFFLAPAEKDDVLRTANSPLAPT